MTVYIHVELSHTFVFEKKSADNIHRRLVNIYGNAALNVSTLQRWVNRFNGNLRERREKLTLMKSQLLT